MPGGTPKVIVAVLVLQILIGGALVYAASQDFSMFRGDDDETPASAQASGPHVDRFDGRRAWRLLVEQVERYGPRPAGSPASRRLAERLRRALPNGRFERVPGGLRNVVGTIPGSRPAILIGAHYDTEAEPVGHVGANDGAAGTAAVVELARTFRRLRRGRDAPELRFVLFDGEEEPAGCVPFEACGLRGSKAYARAHAKELGAVIVLDYIAERGARIRREGFSDRTLWARLRAAARRVGAQATFPAGEQGAIIDDHVPFLERGVPAIDLIDFDYPERDTLRDRPDRLSVHTLDAVGETVTELVLRLRPGDLRR
jgi:hypothetical protein